MTTAVSESRFVRSWIFGLSAFVCLAVCVVIFLVPAQGVTGGPSPLASINAALNGAAGVLLVLGYRFVRAGNIAAHRACMLAAFSVSSLFLVTYLLHHARVGSVPFQGAGMIRVVYFSVLIPHIVIAALIVPLALFTIYRGWTKRVEAHRKIARITLPLWLYVSASGVVLYFMLYHL